MKLKKPLQQEGYKIGVELFNSDKNINLLDNYGLICGIRYESDDCGIDLVGHGPEGFNVEQFFYVIGIDDNEKNMQIER